MQELQKLRSRIHTDRRELRALMDDLILRVNQIILLVGQNDCANGSKKEPEKRNDGTVQKEQGK